MTIPLIALPLLAASLQTPVETSQPPAPPPTEQAVSHPPAPVAEPVSQPPAPAPLPEPAKAAPPSNGNGNANTSDIVVSARQHIAADPAEAINVQSFKAVQAVDKAIIGPVAHSYKRNVPTPIQSGLHNFLNNLDEPIVFLNFLLQFKPGKAAATLGRFALNSTVGIGGLMDVARKRPFCLARRSNGLADTLAYYGVGPGPYFFLPLIGSTTLRDGVVRPIDLALLPTLVGKPFSDPTVSLAKGTLNGLDDRANFDEQLEKLRDESPDSYAAVRDYYLARRKAEIEVLHGKRRMEDVPGMDPRDLPSADCSAAGKASTTPAPESANPPSANPPSASPQAMDPPPAG